MRAMVKHVDDHGVLYDCLAFICPGCQDMFPEYSGLHLLPINTTEHQPSWSWDGNLYAPTLTPSILTGKGTDKICHSFLRGGVFEFLGDCTHALVGQHVDLPHLPKWFTHPDEYFKEQEDNADS